MWTDLLEKYKPAAVPLPAPGCYTNWLGIQTEASFFAHSPDLAGKKIENTPIPDDGVYGGASEYAAVLIGMERRRDPARLIAVELGAAWGPWISAAGVASIREGIPQINLVGVEADEFRCTAMQAQLERNGLTEENGVHSKIIRAAAWSDDRILQFGIADSLLDHGGAATETVSETDYRGFTPTYHEVPGLSVATICEGLPYIDLMHWDIQGAELEVAKSSIDYLNNNVGTIFIGTHSPALHGALIDLFFRNGWDLIDHEYPGFKFDKNLPSLEIMTGTDGELLFVNDNF